MTRVRSPYKARKGQEKKKSPDVVARSPMATKSSSSGPELPRARLLASQIVAPKTPPGAKFDFFAAPSPRSPSSPSSPNLQPPAPSPARSPLSPGGGSARLQSPGLVDSPLGAPKLSPAFISPGQVGIDALEYFHGLVPREDINELLARDGDYLLRSTEIIRGSAQRQMCLSVKWSGVVRHFPLQPDPTKNGTYALDGSPQFETLLQLVEHYQRTGSKFSRQRIRLSNPIKRQKWELLHNQVTLEKRIGEGAFGAVYAGRLVLSPREPPIKVAVKTFKVAFQSKEKIEEIMSEARIMRHMHHVNIVRCYGVAAEMEPLFIIMEFVGGGALNVYLRESGNNLTIPVRLRMVLGVARAIEYVHSLGIIHRDVAARNCLYDKEVKLSDFGFSKKAKKIKLSEFDRTPLRWTGPEVYNSQLITATNDIWALGILVWEIFSNGKEPYEGWTGKTVREQVVNNRYRLTMPKTAPLELTRLFQRMTEYDPALRIGISEIRLKMEDLCKKYSTMKFENIKVKNKNDDQRHEKKEKINDYHGGSIPKSPVARQTAAKGPGRRRDRSRG